MRKKIIIGIVLLIAAFLIFRQYQSTQAAKPVYTQAAVSRGTIVSTLTASGTVSSANNVSATTQASGLVKQVYVKNGAKVKSGQAILTLDLDANGSQAYSQALASYQGAVNLLQSAQNNLNTLQNAEFTANQKFINDAVARNLLTSDPTYIMENANWLAAENSYKNQQNVINQAQNNLYSASLSLRQSSPTVYAPIAGTINGLYLQPGSIISSTSTKVANISTGGNPMVSVNLTEIDVAKVKVGDKATITLDALPGKTYTGQVVGIDSAGTVSSGVVSYVTYISLDSISPEIFANMSATANIILQIADNVLNVPSSAIQSQGNQTTVRVLQNGNLSNIPVEIGITDGSVTEIKSGLTDGEQIVTSVTTPTTSTTQSNSGTSVFSTLGGNRGGFGGATAIRGGRGG